MTINTGGPAFPLETSTAFQNPGMTLRDYFAAKAMAAVIIASDSNSTSIIEIDNWLGKYAYAAADCLLEARKS